MKCPLLAKVLLSECDSLATLSLSSGTFRTLNLGTCARLERLELAAPHLHSLDLTGCGALRTAALRCPHLTAADCAFCLSLEAGGELPTPHSTDIEFPPPPPPIYMSIHPEGESCFDLGLSACSE